MILGLDPSTRCGWAILDLEGARVASGCWDLSPRKREGTGARFLRLHIQLAKLYDENRQITHVAYECPGGHFQSRASNLALVGLAMHVESFGERTGLQYREFSASEVKRAAGLGGRAEKDDMVRAANTRWAPHCVARDDEADALFAALALLKELQT